MTPISDIIWHDIPPGVGFNWYLTPVCPDVCFQNGKDMGPFLPQVSEMSEIVSLKMGVKFASSLIIGERLPQELYIIICRNVIAGHI